MNLYNKNLLIIGLDYDFVYSLVAKLSTHNVNIKILTNNKDDFYNPLFKKFLNNVQLISKDDSDCEDYLKITDCVINTLDMPTPKNIVQKADLGIFKNILNNVSPLVKFIHISPLINYNDNNAYSERFITNTNSVNNAFKNSIILYVGAIVSSNDSIFSHVVQALKFNLKKIKIADYKISIIDIESLIDSIFVILNNSFSQKAYELAYKDQINLLSFIEYIAKFSNIVLSNQVQRAFCINILSIITKTKLYSFRSSYITFLLLNKKVTPGLSSLEQLNINHLTTEALLQKYSTIYLMRLVETLHD